MNVVVALGSWLGLLMCNVGVNLADCTLHAVVRLSRIELMERYLEGHEWADTERLEEAG
ncbi:hypothetical protein [Nocardia sp. NPDC050412]|uniref:hypothetical protein n=1 Tax=Nocardia sp. NPDC050412 TaxID=3364320 RepID=UPI0037A7EF38